MSSDKLDPFNTYGELIELRKENKKLKADVVAVQEELSVLKDLFGVAPKPKVKIKPIPHGEILAVAGNIIDKPSSTQLYAQSFIGSGGYCFLYHGKDEQFPFYVQFQATRYDHYTFIKENFGFSSTRQLATLINRVRNRKADIRASLVDCGHTALILNVVGVERQLHQNSRVSAKTYWFTAQQYKNLSKDAYELINSLIRI